MPDRPQINLQELFNLTEERLSQNIRLKSDSFERTKDLLYILAKWQRLRFYEIQDKALSYCYLAKIEKPDSRKRFLIRYLKLLENCNIISKTTYDGKKRYELNFVINPPTPNKEIIHKLNEQKKNILQFTDELKEIPRLRHIIIKLRWQIDGADKTYLVPAMNAILDRLHEELEFLKFNIYSREQMTLLKEACKLIVKIKKLYGTFERTGQKPMDVDSVCDSLENILDEIYLIEPSLIYGRNYQ